MIPYGRQEISEEDIQAVAEVLRSEWLTQGPAVPAFEAAVAAYCRVEHAVAVNSATSALHIACLALGVGPGDRVWTSPITFVASANCALYCGAQVDFVDIDPESNNLSVAGLAERLAHAERAGQLPKVVIPVHLTGRACDMAGIRALADRFGFRIIEDASHAIGARYRDEPVGNCRYSDIAVFSFHPVKIITTGEGGMALTNDPDLASRLRLLRSHGITRDPAEMTTAPHGPWYYQQITLGFNYRMTDLQAALGLSQLSRLDEFVIRRTALADRYDERLTGLPARLPGRDTTGRSAWHLYVLRWQLGRAGRTRGEVFHALREAGIGVNLHYIPVYQHPFYETMGFRRDAWPEAERYYQEAISLPLYAGLTHAQQDHVISILHRIGT